MQDPRLGPSGGGYAVWLMPDETSAAPLTKVIKSLSKTPSALSPDPDARDLSIFDPHLTLWVPHGKAAEDIEFFKTALKRAVQKFRQKMGAKEGQAVGIHLQLDDPAAGTGWWNPVFSPVVQTSGAETVVYLRRLIEYECGEPASPTGWFPFVPDNEWCPLFPLAYTDPEWHWQGLQSMAIRADMVVQASRVVKFPLHARCPNVAILDLRGQVEDWKVVDVVNL